MSLKTLSIKSVFGSYDVIFDDQLISLFTYLEDANAIFLIDEKVFRLYTNLFCTISQERLVLIKANEGNKSYQAIIRIYERLTSFKAKRNLTLVGIGGGIIQDISGFIASTLYRGVKWIYCPTTLLAQADSCIGAKTSLNFGKFKNLIGTFYPPEKVILSTIFLTTLTKKDFYSGMGEIVKLFLIDGKDSVKYFIDIKRKKNYHYRNNVFPLILKSLEIKKIFIEKDEFDKGIRNILNFGHCIGHAIESITNYRIPHGQAVTFGIIWANIISVKKGFLTAATSEYLLTSVLADNITLKKEVEGISPDRIIDAMKKDKKREGQGLAIILVKENYEFVKILDLTENEVMSSFNEFKKRFDLPSKKQEIL
jgi:3-dehydroquinate synthase